MQAHTQRAIEAASQAQERASRAQAASAAVQERVNRAQEASSAASERAQRVSDAVRRAGDAAAAGLEIAAAASDGLPHAAGFHDRSRELARTRPHALELIDRSAAVRGEVVSIDPSPEVLDAARRQGFTIIADETIEGIDLRYVTLRVPSSRSVRRALAELRDLAPNVEFTANHIHLQSGAAQASGAVARLAPSAEIDGSAVGVIDGGVAETGHLPKIMQRGFAAGAPAADAHATALASLIAGTGGVKSASPGAPLLVADVYGRDPAGGNALALARALGWMTKRRVPVVVIGLVGPSNPIVARAVKQAQARGMTVVAPVGNAGAAAPPMFPAAYPDVIGVTGVDGRNRVLVEAGRGPHVDFAAPGADIVAAGMGGKPVKVRGTSYAAPLVAGKLWLARRSTDPVSALDAEAVDLGRRGPDRVFGRGLVCGTCR
jgi:hypothetical protein